MRLISAPTVLDQLHGATIVDAFVEDDEGMHFVFQDGRVLIIAGMFTIGLMRFQTEKLH